MNFCRLTTLTLEDSCEIWDQDLMFLLGLYHLECLQLWRMHRVSSTALLNFFFNSRFENLKQLDLFDCRNLNDEVLQEICIKWVITPKFLHIFNRVISRQHIIIDPAWSHLYDYRCNHLESLDISSCHLLTDAGIAYVFQLCSSLDTLKMSHLPQPTGLGYLDHLTELLPKLIYLDAYNCCNISSDLLASLENKKLIVMFGGRKKRQITRV